MTKLHIALSAAFLFCAATGSHAVEFPVALSPEEVECDRLQLERLSLRMVVAETGPPGTEALNPSLFLWRQPFGAGSFSGLAVTDGVQSRESKPLRDERQLSMQILFGEMGDFLDPRRPLLPYATLARRGQDSNLVSATKDPWLTVTMEAAPQVEDPYEPQIPLIINSLGVASGSRRPLAAADAAGRGFLSEGLTKPCHQKLTAFDEKIFRILSRTLRLTLWFTELGHQPNKPTTWNIVLLRGEDPHIYHALTYAYARVREDSGDWFFFRFAPADLEIEVQWDDQGRLTAGNLRLIPAEDSSTQAIFLLPPMRPGRDRQGDGTFAGKPFLVFEYFGSQANRLTAPVNWEELLANSAWNQ